MGIERARREFALACRRILTGLKEGSPRSVLAFLYAACVPVCVGTSLESLLKQPLPVTLARIHAYGVPLWAEVLLFCLVCLAVGTIGAVAGWLVGGFVTSLAESNRRLGYRALFVAIALPILLISAPLFVLPRARDMVSTVLGVVGAPIVAAALCFRFHRDGWPENLTRE